MSRALEIWWRSIWSSCYNWPTRTKIKFAEQLLKSRTPVPRLIEVSAAVVEAKLGRTGTSLMHFFLQRIVRRFSPVEDTCFSNAFSANVYFSSFVVHTIHSLSSFFYLPLPSCAELLWQKWVPKIRYVRQCMFMHIVYGANYRYRSVILSCIFS